MLGISGVVVFSSLALLFRKEIVEAWKDYKQSKDEQDTNPIVKNLMPSLVASNIVGVQPMSADTGNIFKLKYIHGPNDVPQGTLTHEFIRGYVRRYGTEDIPADIWWKIKIRGL